MEDFIHENLGKKILECIKFSAIKKQALQNLPAQLFFKFSVKVVEDFGHYILGWKILYIPKLSMVQIQKHG